MSPLASETPARGTRPRNRRAITLRVATELFSARGYAQVSMTDIAEAMNVGASALYRHFPSKAELLVAAIRAGIQPYAQVLGNRSIPGGDPQARLAAVLRQLADVAIAHRRLGVLWQRDARNLSDQEQQQLRNELRTTTGELASFLRAARPELGGGDSDALAWFAMGALVSIGFHSLELPPPRFALLMVDIVTRISGTPIPAAAVGEPPVAADPAESESRRDRLITVATELFADRGFAATGIDEIGEAAGIAGPSVYSHFSSKQSILAAAIQRASGMLQHELNEVLSTGEKASFKLAGLVDSYVRLANRDRFVIRTLVSEMDQLEAADRERARREQRQYIEAWVELLREYTDEDAVSARIRVQAVLLVVNDAVQTPHLRSRPGFEQTLTALAERVLGARAG